MRSVIGTIIIFIGIYVVVANDILSFFTRKSTLIFAVCAVIFMLIIAVLVLGFPRMKKGGENHDEDSHLN